MKLKELTKKFKGMVVARKKTTIGIGLVLLIGAAVALGSCGSDKNTEPETKVEATTEVEETVEEVEMVGFNFSHSYTGLIAGETYKIKAGLVDADGNLLSFHGLTFETEHEFVAEAADGVTEFMFTMPEQEYNDHATNFESANVKETLTDKDDNVILETTKPFVDGDEAAEEEVEEVVKEEAAKEEATKPSTDTSASDKDEVTTSKPSTDTSKPSTDTSKPSTDTSKPSTDTSKPSTEKPSTETEKPASHTHKYEAVYENVTIPATYKTETVTVKEAWTESIPVYTTQYVKLCNGCNGDFTNRDHAAHAKEQMLAGNTNCGGWRTDAKKVQTGTETINHPAVTEQRQVEVTPARTEKKLVGHKCSCGATK